jgi:hypothetical protein
MKRRVILGVGVAGYPLSAVGNTWAFVNWGLAFEKSGWEVWLVEHLPAAKLTGTDGRPARPEDCANRAHWNATMERFGWRDRATLFIDGRADNEAEFRHFAEGAELFLNISGHFKPLDLIGNVPRRVYLDLDPGYTQVWAAAYQSDMNFSGHTDFFTVAPLLGTDPERVPSTGHVWKPIRPPVDTDWWSPTDVSPGDVWTTITHWYGYPAVTWNGLTFGNKAEEFHKLAGLPSLVPDRLSVACDLEPGWDDYDHFAARGWLLQPVRPVCSSWEAYASFIAGSRGEFSAAKGGYVVSQAGWFSDRSVCYLACGRPVVLQETGWSRWLPEGEGVLAFRNTEEAAEVIRRVGREPDRHRKAARRLAETVFAGPVVVRDLLGQLS